MAVIEKSGNETTHLFGEWIEYKDKIEQDINEAVNGVGLKLCEEEGDNVDDCARAMVLNNFLSHALFSL